jgi:phosphoglycerate kinase
MDGTAADPFELAEKTVLVRANFCRGVTVRLAGTVRDIAERGARVAVVAGLGDPEGDVNPALSLLRFVEPLARATGKRTTFISESVGTGAEAKLARVPFGEVALLENLRFHRDESRKTKVFAVRLSVLADFYIDAGESRPPENGWQDALRLLLPEPGGTATNQPIDEDA